MLSDREIREKLINRLLNYKGTSIGEELSIITEPVRADIISINKHLIGYEIKSDLDTLHRLPHQCKGYDEIFEMNYLVVGEKLRFSATDLIPNYWGIFFAYCENNKIFIKRIKQASKNPNFNIKSFLFTLPVDIIKEKIITLLPLEKQNKCNNFIKQDLIAYIVNNIKKRDEKRIKKIVNNYIKKSNCFYNPV
ncbi:sce7726 family protein [Fructilactobacillus cliffordii]|uniref:sce7726 family protein n=1 Tax=Fructilactobacillus cliffordii TaxID=2940299 RepID=UPI0020924EAD|nr:sce7726 family protein [Fructilactobacillus cliffordii]USS85912.1 sce7726 family protein [Fructilactobacillus cliffordii]